MIDFLIVNFGGPRHLDEIGPFLEELLCDRDVIRTKFPTFLHNWFFGRIARKRALQIRHDYQLIGGKSPIYFDTETLAKELQALTFHRYLPATHKESLRKIETSIADEIRVLSLFPQFTYATTGSIARFFDENLSSHTVKRLRWIHSYPIHPAFVVSFQRRIRAFLTEQNLPEEKTVLLFSAHGVPQTFIADGDPYQSECELSFQAIANDFPRAMSRLCYQSKFGRGEWIRPYTNETCERVLEWHEGRENIVFVPLSFTSDHIETLFEVDYQYLPLIRDRKLNAYRCPALNLEPYWIEGIKTLFQKAETCTNSTLIRNLPGNRLLSMLRTY